MSIENSLGRLQKRNNVLKSKLLHEKLKHGNFPDTYFKKEMLMVLSEYKTHRSILKAASIVGIKQDIVLDWYIRGQQGDEKFRGFYLAICDINNGLSIDDIDVKPVVSFKISEKSLKLNIGDAEVKPEEFQEEYLISQYGDGWSYKTYVDGEKIFLISSDLDKLKEKVRAKNLPLD